MSIGKIETGDADQLVTAISSAFESGFMQPEIVELSIVDPDDPERRRVIAPLMISKQKTDTISQSIVRKYHKEMVRNIRAGKPIVPHTELYTRMVWAVMLSTSKRTDDRRSHDAVTGWEVSLLAYDLSKPTTTGSVEENIRDFANRFHGQLHDDLKERINCLLVLPFSSPIRYGKLGPQNTQGGALFVWGQSRGSMDWDWAPTILNIRELLHQTVLQYSAARAEMRATLAMLGMLAHHLKNLFPEQDAPDVAADLERLRSRLKEVVWRLPAGDRKTPNEDFVERSIGEMIEELADLKIAIPAYMYSADEFRTVFDLMAQSTRDKPWDRLAKLLDTRHCPLIDVLSTATTVTSNVTVSTTPVLRQIPDAVELLGPKLLYDIIMRELIRNADRHHAKKMEIKFFGCNWSGPPDLLGDWFWMTLSNDGDPIHQKPPRGKIEQPPASTGMGIWLIRRFLLQYHLGYLQEPEQAQHRVAVRMRLRSYRPTEKST